MAGCQTPICSVMVHSAAPVCECSGSSSKIWSAGTVYLLQAVTCFLKTHQEFSLGMSLSRLIVEPVHLQQRVNTPRSSELDTHNKQGCGPGSQAVLDEWSMAHDY